MSKEITVALAGNPNSGKTTIFNALTGARHKVGNYPGVTVEKKEGLVKVNGHKVNFVDLPGTYSLTAYSIEELVARNYIVEGKPDVVVDIIDSSNLERNMYLAVQLMELDVPLVLAFNMSDLAESRGIEIDTRRLSKLLGVPIVETVGNTKKGIAELGRMVVDVATGKVKSEPVETKYEEEVEKEIGKITGLLKGVATDGVKYPHRWLAVKLLEHDSEVEELLYKDDKKWPGINSQYKESRERLMSLLKEDSVNLVAEGRYGFINGVVRDTVRRKREEHITSSDRIDKVLLNRALGLPIFVVVMYLVFQAVFTWAGPLMDLVDAFFGWLGEVTTAIIPEGVVQSLIVDGIIGGVGGVIIFLPQILFLFFFIALLEDSGYMARAAFIMDRIMSRFGLNGKAFIPLLSSYACAIPGIMATRTMESRKNRLVTMLIAPLMSCAARLPVYALLIAALIPAKKIFGGTIGAQGFTLFSLYFGGTLIALLMAILFKSTVLKEETPPFVMELPPYRLPTLKGMLIHMWERSKLYLKKAGTIILAISIVLWFLFAFPGVSKNMSADEYRAERDKAAVILIGKTGYEPEAFEDAYVTVEEFEVMVEESGFEEGTKEYIEALKVRDERLASIEDQGIVDALNTYTAEGGYLTTIGEIDAREGMDILENSYGGRLGHAILPFFSPLGMDWRMSVAMVSSFAAKEVFVAAMGTLYSLGEEEGEDSPDLIESVREDPLLAGQQGVLLAIVIMVFSLLSTPCMATVAVIKQESGSWKWAGFLVFYTLALAWLVCFAIWQGGRLFIG